MVKSTRTIFFAIATIVLGSCNPARDENRITALTFNIRYANPGDGVHVWENRKDWVAEIIRDSDADVVGLQEALRDQIDTLASKLDDYEWIGVGRSDGVNGGEFSPIFYRADRVDLQETSTFWLSSDPELAGSAGWDAALPRIVTWARFRLTSTGRSFFHFNTHFDHRGDIARLESAVLLRERIQEIAGQQPVVLTGDFNTLDSEPPYQALVESFPGIVTLLDSRVAASQTDLTTFRGFEVGSTDARTIDYIFHTRGFEIRRHRVLDEDRAGRFPSDHLPVLAEFSFQDR